MASSVSTQVGELFAKHAGMVYRRCLRLLGRPADAEEATQEVFVRAMRGWAEFDHRSTVTTWLYQITTHYCLDLLRQGTRRQRLLQQNVELEDQSSEVSAADQLHLRRLLAEADEEQARAVIYVYFDDMSHEQAAAVLGVSKRTVGNLIERFLAWAQKRSN